MSNPLSGVDAPCNTPIEPVLNANSNEGIQLLPNPTTTVAQKARRHSFSMNHSVQFPKPHLVKNLGIPITSAGVVDRPAGQSVNSEYVKSLKKRKENLEQNTPAQQTLTRIINLLNSISTTGDFSSDCIHSKITEVSQNGSEPQIQPHQDNKFGASYPKSKSIYNTYGNEPWPQGTIPIDCNKVEPTNPLTNPPHTKPTQKEELLQDATIHWPVDMNDETKKKYLSQLHREIDTFSGNVTIRKLLPGEVLMRDIGTKQTVKASCWTKGNGKDFVHNGQSLHQNLAVKPEWNGGGTLAIFIVPNEVKFYVAEGKIASQKIETFDGTYEFKGGRTQLNILTPADKDFAGNEEIFNKCVAVIPNTGINLENDIPDEVKLTSLFD